MADIPIQLYTFPPFRGLNFKDAPLNVPPPFARRATHIDFDLLGAVSKSNGYEKINSSQLPGNPAILGLYEYVQTDGDRFFIVYTGDNKFYKLDYSTGVATDITPANVSLSAGSRPHFYTYNGLLLVGDGVSRPIYTSGAVTSSTWFRVGVSAPLTTLTATVSATAGNPNGLYTYKVVFVSPTGAKSNASIASSPQVNAPGKQIDLTNIPINSNAQENVSAREIYRTAAGGAVYYYLTTINDNTTATYTDDIADTALGERLVEEKETPPVGLQGFVEYNGSVYGFVKDSHDLRFTAINEAEAWSVFNVEPIAPGDGTGIRGLGVLNRLCIFKEKSIDTWEGIPGLFRRIRRSKRVGCISHNTIKNVDLPNDGGEVLFFLSRQGVYMFDEQDTFYLSREIETIFNGKDDTYIFNANEAHKATAEFSTVTKKYYLSIPVNESTEPNLVLIYDIYAQSWALRPINMSSLAIRTEQSGIETIAGGEARSDATFGGLVYTLDESTSLNDVDYSGEYATAWNHLDFPNNVKLLRYIELDFITQGDFNLIVGLFVDGSEVAVVAKPVSMSAGGALFDISFFDQAYFASDAYNTTIIGLNKINARHVSVGLRTDEKGKPWKVLAMRIMHQPLPPAGDRR